MSTISSTAPTFDAIRVGDALPTLTLPPVNRTTLALFGGASGDHNPIHLDLDVARRAGMPDVFAQGMLGMAWLGRLLTGWVPQSRLRRFDVRFLGITQLGHLISCSGEVVKKQLVDGERQLVIELRTVNQYGETRIAGDAVVVLP
ncbi:MAG TPA: MaoC family dehydratase [Burkholderiaceae bacterium]|jgi:acyl dehydratase